MTLPLRVAWCAPLVALVLLIPAPTTAQEQPLRFLGELDIPTKSLEIDGTTVGGLSGIAYDARRNVYYIISDDRGDFGPARFYTARIGLGLDGVRSVDFIGTTVLDSDAATPGIQPYDANDTDTEEIILMPDDTLLISSERDRQGRPWLRRFGLDGSLLDELPIPEAFQVASMQDGQGRTVQTRGVRNNLGFEGVTLAPDESALYAMNEEALAQDGPISTQAAGTVTRLLRYSTSTGSFVPGRQAVYRTEPIFAMPVPPDQFADNGVSGMLFIRTLLPQFDFLVMERAFVTGVGNKVTLYGARVGSAPDVSMMATLPSPYTGGTMQKTLVLDMASVGVAPDNLEGIAIGPRLPDGNPSLLVISDDNFSDIQLNQFLLFEINAPAGK